MSGNQIIGGCRAPTIKSWWRRRPRVVGGGDAAGAAPYFTKAVKGSFLVTFRLLWSLNSLLITLKEPTGLAEVRWLQEFNDEGIIDPKCKQKIVLEKLLGFGYGSFAELEIGETEARCVLHH